METMKKPVWFKTSEKEIKKIVDNLISKGYDNEKIGLILRDQYGIPKTRVIGKKLSELTGKNMQDLENLKKKLEKAKEHFQKNKQDKIAKRKVAELTSKINKLRKYYDKKQK